MQIIYFKKCSKMFDDAVEILGVEPGLAKQIKSCNSTHTIRFGVKLKKGIRSLLDGDLYTLNILSQ